MPFVAPVIGWLFTSLVSVFARWFVLEKAFKLAFATIIIGLIFALVASMSSCVSGVCGAAISGMSSSHHNFAVGLGAVFNGTTLTAVSCYMAVWTGCQLYTIKKRLMDLLK